MEMDYTPSIVKRTLEKLNYFTKLKESGNVDAIATMIDMKDAVKFIMPELTQKQKEIFQYRYIWVYSLNETAKAIGIARQTISDQEDAIAEKIYCALNGGMRYDFLRRQKHPNI